MLSGLSLPMLATLMTAGVLLDMLLGETRRWHPLVGFGRLASTLERLLNRGRGRFPRGALAWSLAVLPLSYAAWWLCGLAAPPSTSSCCICASACAACATITSPSPTPWPWMTWTTRAC